MTSSISRGVALAFAVALGSCAASAGTQGATAHQTTPRTTAATQAPTATTAASLDCGRVEQELEGCAANGEAAARCFVDAFQANRAARLVWRGTGDEGSHVETEYTVVPGAGGATIAGRADASGDPASVAPTITMQCRSAEVAQSSLGCANFNPRECTCDPSEAC